SFSSSSRASELLSFSFSLMSLFYEYLEKSRTYPLMDACLLSLITAIITYGILSWVKLFKSYQGFEVS
ncbi:MAG: hypothetical protein WCL90_15110, partial [Planctomycetota bacterium]